jgi:multidrug efflux system outer membrane protein
MTPLAEVPAGLPSALLQRRPDIVASEHALQAANANIGAARAKFFPSISLTANAGLASSNLSGLFKAGAGAWQFSPSVSLPLLDGGSLQAGVDSARVAYQSAVASYDKTVQTAFREVADALAVRGTMRSQLAAQQALVDSSRQTFAQVEARFKAGADSYLTVLTAQRSLYAAEQALISLQLSDANNRITLYKVLGGGWQPDATTGS